MAKQNINSGVVQSAQMVAAAENQFVNIGGAFSAGMQSVFEKRRAQEEAVRKRKAKLGEKFKTLEVDFNLGDYGLSDEEQQMASKWLIKQKKDYAAYQLALKGIEDKTSEEALEITQAMNGIRSSLKNFKKDLDARVKLQTDHLPDGMGDNPMMDGYSSSQLNEGYLENLEVVTTQPYENITDDGHMVFQGGRTFADVQLPFAKAEKEQKEIATLFSKANNKGEEYDQNQLGQLMEDVKNVFSSNKVVASLLSSDFTVFDGVINDDFKTRWATAFKNKNEEDLTALKQELQNTVVSALQDAAKNSVKPTKPKGGGGSGLTQTKLDHLKPLEDMAADPNYVAKIGADGGGFYKFVPTMRGTTVNVFLMTDEFGTPVQDDNGKFKTLTIKQYANQLGVSERTVRKKLGI